MSEPLRILILGGFALLAVLIQRGLLVLGYWIDGPGLIRQIISLFVLSIGLIYSVALITAIGWFLYRLIFHN